MIPTFPSVFEAYQWSQEILSQWRNGRAFDPNPELFRGGMGVMGSIMVALDIENIAWKACINGRPCPNFCRDCLLNWYLPEATQPPAERSSHHTRRIENCAEQFRVYLQMRGYVE